MFQRMIFSALFVAAATINMPVWAQVVSSMGLFSPSIAQKHGLTRAWHTQIELDRARGEISALSQHVSSTRVRTVWQVVQDGQRYDFEETVLDAFGKPIGAIGATNRAAERILNIVDEIRVKMPAGMDEAALTATEQAAKQVLQNIADHRNQQKASREPLVVDIDGIASALLRRAEATPDGIPTFVKLVIPEVALYVATSQGVVHALDAETGRTRWALPIGRPNHPSFAPAANDEVVCVVNGSVLYVVDSENGELIWKRQMKGVPGAAPAVTHDMVYVPLVKESVEAYRLFKLDERYQWPITFMSTGRGLIRPTTTSGSVCWPTDRGYFYVADSVQAKPRFRLEANNTIVAPASYLANNKLIVASIDGYVYCVQEYSGQLLWRFSTGQPISHMPIALGDEVYVIIDDGGMFRVSGETGEEIWWTPEIRGFTAASDTRLYCTDHIGRTVIVDRESGGRLATIPTLDLDLKVVNWQTDRLYVGTKSGVIQCLHETQLDKPLFHVNVEIVKQAPAEEIKDKGKGEMDDAKPMDPDNPFGGGGGDDNPFGGGKKADDPFGGGGGNPFGGGGGDGKMDDNPFGGGAGGGADDKKDDNPFGAGANPFG